jgi:hypothetical protein
MLSGALAKQRVQDLGLAEWSGKLERKELVRLSKIMVKSLKDIEADDEDEAQVVNMRNIGLSKPWKDKYKKMVKIVGIVNSDRGFLSLQ